MKKLISAVLAGTITLSLAAPCAFADEKLEKIIINVKNRAEITDEYTDFSSNYTDENDDYTEYSLEWNDKDNNKSIRVRYNSDDVITMYRKYWEKDYSDRLSLPKVSIGEARDKAQKFLGKINPSAEGEYCFSDMDSNPNALSGDYLFSLIRLKNGLTVRGFYGSMEVDRDSAEIYSMWLPYQHIDEFEDVSDMIPTEEAKAAFKEKIGLELAYYYYYDDKELKVFPVYKEADENKYISAVTGEVYEPKFEENFRYAMTSMSVAENAMADKEDAGGLSQIEIDEIEKIDGLISKANIEKKIRANKTLGIPSDLKLASINLQRDYYDNTQYTYSMNFNNDKDFIIVSVNAKTGEIKSFYNYNRAYDEEELKEDKVKAAAEKIFNALAGAKKSEYRFEKMSGGSVLYRRYVNGVKVMGDTINIGVDKNGKLVSYNAKYTANASFDKLDGIISADEAADKLFEAAEYDAVYLPEAENEKTVAKALYMFDESRYVNPFTGAIVDYRNEEVKESGAFTYSDIDNHWARQQIETLANYGIGFEGGEFKPDDKITQRDFLYLILKSSYSYINDDNDDIYRIAKREKLINDRDDNAEVTRGEMAKIMIRFMDAEEFAKYDDIYASPFKDVTEDKGYSAILSAMGIVKGDEQGNFNPQKNMTRAEAAGVIYNYLNR